MKDLVRLKLEQDERRIYARAVKFISGCVLVEDKVLNCMVIDLSVNGARLLFDRPLPDFQQATVRLALRLRLANPIDLPMRVAWRDSMLLGSPAEITEQLGRWVDAGIDHFILMTPRPFDARVMERFAQEVAPHFA